RTPRVTAGEADESVQVKAVCRPQLSYEWVIPVTLGSFVDSSRPSESCSSLQVTKAGSGACGFCARWMTVRFPRRSWSNPAKEVLPSALKRARDRTLPSAVIRTSSYAPASAEDASC